MKINELEKIFAEAKENNKDVAVEITLPLRRENEVIIVKNDNIDYKLIYYINNYTENLELVRCRDIKIISAKIIKWEEN